MKTNMLEKLELMDNKTPPLVPLEHLMSYVTSAHFGVIQHWLEQGMKQSPREMALTLASMTFWVLLMLQALNEHKRTCYSLRK